MLNRVFLIGNIGADPTLREAGDRKSATLRLATRRTWKDADGNRQKDTQWHDHVMWGCQAELAAKLLKKGQLLFVEGRLNHTSWPDRDHPEHIHYRTEIVTESFLILSIRNASPADPQPTGSITSFWGLLDPSSFIVGHDLLAGQSPPPDPPQSTSAGGSGRRFRTGRPGLRPVRP